MDLFIPGQLISPPRYTDLHYEANAVVVWVLQANKQQANEQQASNKRTDEEEQTEEMIPTQVIKRMNAEKVKKRRNIQMLTNIVDTMEQISWGDLAMEDEVRHDAPYLAMTNEEYLAYLHSEEGKKMDGRVMIRINLKRRDRANATPEEPIEEAPKTPAYWYNEYTKYPHLYFANEAEQKVAIAEVLDEWRTGVGRWRFSLMTQAAKKIQDKWVSVRPGRCEVCKKEKAVYVDKYESCVCENCMNGMCKNCKVAEATPGSITDQCVGCYVRFTLEKDLRDMEDELEWQREQRRYDFIR